MSDPLQLAIDRSGKGYTSSFIEDEFNKALQFDEPNRAREKQNWNMYSGFDHGQWPSDAVASLSAQNRHIPQFNIIRGKIDGLAGSIVKNWYNTDYVPIDGADSEYTRLLKNIYLSDKELMDWEGSYLDIVIDGLVHRGIEELVVSDRYNPLGNLAFKRIMPGHVVVDPDWMSNNGWDLRRLWKVAYITPDEMKKIYKTKAPEIDIMIQRAATAGATYDHGPINNTTPHMNLDTVSTHQFRVIEYHHIRNFTKSVDFVIAPDNKPDIEIPEGSKEQKDSFIKEKNIDTSLGRVTKEVVINEYWVTTICPELSSDPLEDRKHELQIGRLPFFCWSAARICGKDSGIVEILIDVQQTLNKRESLIDHIISTAAHGGRLIDPAIVNNDGARVSELVKNISKPNMVAITAPGALASGRNYIRTLEQNTYSGDLQQDIRRMSDYSDRISKQTSTLDGMSSSSHDTGTLFARRQMQSEIAQTIVSKALERHQNEKGEAYMLAAQILYKDVYRQISVPSLKTAGRNIIGINETVETYMGSMVVNDISKIPRHKVIVSQSESGVTVRETERAINSELLNNIPGDNAMARAILVSNILNTLDLSNEIKDQLAEVSKVQLQAAYEQTMASVAQSKFTQAQVQAQLSQMQQQEMMAQQQAQAAQQQAAQGGQPPQEGAPPQEGQPAQEGQPPAQPGAEAAPQEAAPEAAGGQEAAMAAMMAAAQQQ
jgi:hypothetical protein